MKFEDVEKIMLEKRKKGFKEELKELNCEDDNILEYVMEKNKYSPFTHYLDFLDDHLSICSKHIEQIYGMENYDKYNYQYQPLFFRPFARKDKGYAPERWHKYNKLKHEKLKNYDNCTFFLLNLRDRFFLKKNIFYF